MRPEILIVTCSLLCQSGFICGADILQADDSRFGPGSLTVDTSTGLAWLDVNLTRGLSYSQVVDQTGSGAMFEGFRHATAEEIESLWRSAGIVDIDVFDASQANIQPALNLIALVGSTSSQDGYPEVAGISATKATDLPSLGRQMGATLDFGYSSGIPSYDARIRLAGNSGADQSADHLGSWLVRPIPEPSLWIFLTVGGLFFRFVIGKSRT